MSTGPSSLSIIFVVKRATNKFSLNFQHLLEDTGGLQPNLCELIFEMLLKTLL